MVNLLERGKGPCKEAAKIDKLPLAPPGHKGDLGHPRAKPAATGVPQLAYGSVVCPQMQSAGIVASKSA
eukprot:CAMPEP_0171245012 /NCGR_PEP_ID=MMETSP0790-20130122/47190_1 /TAXON_ID=2925 /ORGANISM="Alexandrium catenella, Strain OF101" /LENGTH=68 /DNA_ID=CAMNT_0011712237 /DNA_START=23 /DNA_END=226 /DNA_ORIENTATION=+